MPGSELRTAAAKQFQRKISRQSRGLVRDTAGGVVGTGRALYEGFDLLTGIPTFIDDPTLENGLWAAASVLPFGKVAKGASSGVRFGLDAARALPIRTIRGTGKIAAHIPGAGSKPGQFVEDLLDAVRTEKSANKRIAKELAISNKNRQAVLGAGARGLERIGRKMNAAEQTTLRIMAEGQSTAAQIAYHQKQAAQALARGEKTNALYHSIHEDLVKQARKWIVDTPAGPILGPAAPRSLREAWRLLGSSTSTREEIYKGLKRLTDERIANRIHAPRR
jgi:hypothetical protein